MSELSDIVERASACYRKDERFLIATLVRVRGSSYRRPGARLLITESGECVGGVSAGCLEHDLRLRGAWQTAESPARLLSYDSRAEGGEGTWGDGLGCNGVVDLLLERSDSEAARYSLEWIMACLESESVGGLATVFFSTAPDVALGSRVWVRAGLLHSTVSNPQAQNELSQCAYLALDHRNSDTVSLEVGGGRLEALVEPIVSPRHLFVCGAGIDAVPLIQLAGVLGWKVTLWSADSRLSTRERFAGLAEIHGGDEQALAQRVNACACPIVVVMTHEYPRDRRLLQLLLPSRAVYLGVLGPRRRTAQLLEELERDPSFMLSPVARRRLRAPVGLSIGAETPAEIALSIAAEVTCCLSHAPGGHLSDREGSIHPQQVAALAGALRTDTE